MSAYIVNYRTRYEIPKIQHQTEVAVVTAAGQIKNEDPGAPDHANRTAWAHWVDSNSGVAALPFMWPVAMNPAIQGSIETDPTGESVPDTDIQFVVNSNVEAVITEWAKTQPPPAL
jgi:hypothetical protein